jgi:hypothetical protein
MTRHAVMRTVTSEIATCIFISVILTALYDEGIGDDLGRGQRGWLLHRLGHEPRASQALHESAEQSVIERRGFVL